MAQSRASAIERSHSVFGTQTAVTQDPTHVAEWEQLLRQLELAMIKSITTAQKTAAKNRAVGVMLADACPIRVMCRLPEVPQIGRRGGRDR